MSEDGAGYEAGQGKKARKARAASRFMALVESSEGKPDTWEVRADRCKSAKAARAALPEGYVGHVLVVCVHEDLDVVTKATAVFKRRK